MTEHIDRVRAAPTQLRTVLIVDASTALLHTCSAIISNNALTCLPASDTVQALCAIVEHEPLAVLIDADSGPLPAWQFCILVKQHPRYCSIRLIVSSPDDDEVQRARASASGAEHFLPRPFTAEELLALLPLDAVPPA